MTIIGLTGLKGSGKSTVANYITNNYNFSEYALADPIKKIAMIFGFSEKDVYGSQEDKNKINDNLGLCARDFLQKFGTEICRNSLKKNIPNFNLGDSGIIWIKLMEDFINKNINKDIVISDVRFIDEMKSIKKYPNSIIIKIIRPIQNSDNKKDKFLLHSSESSINEINADFTIMNNGDINDLYKKINNILVLLNYFIV
jgi:dephospho-CoA kinase